MPLPTEAVQNHQAGHHEDGVPVELQTRAVPGEASVPVGGPEDHEEQTEQAQTQAGHVGEPEPPGRTHVWGVWEGK